MGRKKKFIEKEDANKFYLVHRSQRDPLFLDETAGEHVLVPVDPENEANHKLADTLNGLTGNQLSAKSRKEMDELKLKRLAEQQKFGIYYEDDYNYLQHMRETGQEDTVAMEEAKSLIKVGSVLIKDDIDETGSVASTSGSQKQKLQLPASLFASEFEEEVGYFNQAAPDSDPKINWDPEIVKILDEDADIDFDDPENALEDDFFAKLNSGEGDGEDDNDDDDDDDDEDTLTENSDNDAYGGRSDEDDDDEFGESRNGKMLEAKSRFSTYSMSSSVVRRNESLKNIDQHFEKFFEQYDEDQIGALDTDDIEGKTTFFFKVL
jgi:protein LTV1